MFPSLYPIVNITNDLDPITYARELFACGVKIIQLRAKDTPDYAFTTIAKEIIRIRSNIQPQTKIIINDSIQVCIDSNADGVHLGQEDNSPQTAKKALKKKSSTQPVIIGLSTHSKEQLLQAPFNILTYCALGPIFHSPTKNGHAAEIGLEILATCATICPIPLVAIGGITLETAQSIYKAGASSIALISDLAQSENIKATINAYHMYCFQKSN